MRVDRRVLLGGLAVSVVQSVPGFAASEGSAEPHTVTLASGETTLPLAGPKAPPSRVWAFNGAVPGPLIRVRQGSEVTVDLVNGLAQPSGLCWHGMRIDNAAAGVVGLTQPPVPPGGRFTYRFRARDAGLFWYHPVVWPHTAEQVGRGLFGAVVVDEAEPPPVDAERLLVLHDWLLRPDGQISGGFAGADRIGSTIGVDGAPAPAHAALRPGARLRLRILNACSARIAVLRIDGAAPTVIAIDGQPSELFPPARNVVPVGPGSRVELMVDVPKLAGTASVVLLSDGAPDQPLLQIAVAGAALGAKPAVSHLPPNPALPARIALEQAQRVSLAVGAVPHAARPGTETTGGVGNADRPAWAWSINGVPSDGTGGRPLFSARKGSVVVLTIENRTNAVQQMYVGGHVFRVLHDLDDGWDPYWRDSIIVLPGKAKHLALVADNPGRWPVVSSMLNRQVSGLAAFFVVTDEAVGLRQGRRKKR